MTTSAMPASSMLVVIAIASLPRHPRQRRRSGCLAPKRRTMAPAAGKTLRE